MTDENTNTSLGLAEMIAGLREELVRSQDLAKDSKIQFEIQNIDLEVKMHVEKARDTKGNFGIKFWVVDLGTTMGETEKDNRTQTIKLSMKAKDLNAVDTNGKPTDANVSASGQKRS